MGHFPRAVGGFEYLYVAIDEFTKWPEVEAVRKVTAQSAVKFFKGLVCRFGVPNRVITDNGTQPHLHAIHSRPRQQGLFCFRGTPTEQRLSGEGKC